MPRKYVHPENRPLRVEVNSGVLSISIGIETLKYVAEHHDGFYNFDTNKYTIVVSDRRQFARDVVGALQTEEEDGTTPVHRLLDAAIAEAVDQGSEGVDYDAMDALVGALSGAEK